jgi:hypothetical protein
MCLIIRRYKMIWDNSALQVKEINTSVLLVHITVSRCVLLISAECRRCVLLISADCRRFLLFSSICTK